MIEFCINSKKNKDNLSIQANNSKIVKDPILVKMRDTMRIIMMSIQEDVSYKIVVYTNMLNYFSKRKYRLIMLHVLISIEICLFH